MEGELKTFLAGWEDNPLEVKKSFIRLKEHLEGKKDLALAFKARPGVSYSLRAKHALQKKRELFVIMDVIDDPETRWLSICFYPDMIADLIISYNTSKGARHSPFRQGHQGCGHWSPTLDYHVGKFALHVRWRIIVHFADIVQAALPETKDLK